MEACLNKKNTTYNLNKTNKNEEIKLIINKGVFHPTQTTKFLLDAVIKSFPKKKVNILDLGCGNGVIGIYLLKKYKNINNLCFADTSNKAIINAKENCKLNKIPKKKINFIKSNIFEFINNFKFDIIINDISRISYKIAMISDWFNNVPCESGDDGTRLTLNVLKNFKYFLKPNGIMYFPIISLSNENKINNFLRRKKIRSKLISMNEWPIPKNMYKHNSMLKKLRNSKKINYENKFGLIIANTKIIKVK